MFLRTAVGAGALVWMACLVVPGFGQQLDRRAEISAQLAGLNAQIADPAAAPAENVLSRRAALLEKLVRLDPGKAVEFVLPRSVRERLGARQAGSAIEQEGEWEGTFEAIVYDDFEHRRSRTDWHLNTPDGKLSLFFFAGKPPAPPGSRVKVGGIRFGRSIVPRSVRREELADSPPCCSPLGPQNILVILVTTPAFPSFPAGADKAYFERVFFGTGSDAAESVNGFWLENSYGLTSATGQVIGPVSIATNHAGCAQPVPSRDPAGDFTDEAIAAAGALVDLTRFTRIVFVFPATGCAWGGISSVGCWDFESPGKGKLHASKSWLPVSPTELPYGRWVSLPDHELGHALGVVHSSIEDYDSMPLGPLDDPGPDFRPGGEGTLPYPASNRVEYGDLFSAMGSGSTAHYNAVHKSLVLGWLKPGQYVEVTSSGTFNLQPFESSADPRALRILRDGARGAWLWAEYRQPIGPFDSVLSEVFGGSNVFDGALIHYENPELYSPGSTYLLNFNPVAHPNSFNNPVLLPGQSWSDPYSPLTLTVNGAGPSGLSMTVNYDSPCAALQVSSTSFPSDGGSGSIFVTAPESCEWVATAYPQWITLGGATTGHGDGLISVTAAANADAPPRSGYVTVARKSTAVFQAGKGLSVLSASPAWGMGASGQFTFEFVDSNGYGDISNAGIQFEGLAGEPPCAIQIDFRGRQFYLNRADTEWTPLTGAERTLSNGLCSVSSTGVSIRGKGDVLTVVVQVAFEAAFAGGHRISASVASDAVWSSPVPFGVWVVPPASETAGKVAVTIAANPAGALFTVDGGAAVLAPATFRWNPGESHTIAWLDSRPGQSGVTYRFLGWSDGGSNPRTIAVPSSPVTYTANLVVSGQGYVIQTIAGGLPPASSVPATSQAIPAPKGVAADTAGAVYFSAGASVYKLDGGGLISRFAGTGRMGRPRDGGQAVEAELNDPQGLAVDSSGNVYVADAGGAQVYRIGTDGRITAVAGTGSWGNSGDAGPATRADLGNPAGVAWSAGNLYIADSGKHVVRRVAADGTITTVAGSGTEGDSGDGGPAVSARLSYPSGVAVDAAGNLYIADRNNHRIRKVAADGKISTVAGRGSPGYSGDKGSAVSARLNSPQAVAIAPDGGLYIADQYNHAIRRVTADGRITTRAGTGNQGYSGDAGPAAEARLDVVYGLAVDRAGNLYIADNANHRIRKVGLDAFIATVAGGATGDGKAAGLAGLNQPAGVARDSAGNLYIADTNNHRVRKVAPDGVISTVAGTGIAGDSGDGGPAIAAQLRYPYSVAADGAGNVYIADSANQRVRKIARDGIISTVAGSSECCDPRDNGPATAAWLDWPKAVALDSAGNLLIATGNRVRKVGADGRIVTIAGTGDWGYSGDGGRATGAWLSGPRGIAVDAAGNIFIADEGNQRVRKVTPAGVITTVVGTGTWGQTGDGGPAASAQIGSPYGVVVEGSGDLLVLDGYQIRRVRDGIISTVAGKGNGIDLGDGGPAIAAGLRFAQALAVDGSGNLYVADTGHDSIRLLAQGASPLLTIESSHRGRFTAGAAGTFTLLVRNILPAAATSGTVTVTETLPAALTLVSMSGPGWTCNANTCTRGDSLSGGTYPPILVMVRVAATAPPQFTNRATVSGGGSASSSADDLTLLLAPPAAPVLSSPDNGASGVGGARALAWSPSAGAAIYDVYFGVSSPPPLVASTVDASYGPGPLQPATTYFWQIAARSSAGAARSEIRWFTTACEYALRPTSIQAPVAGGSYSVNVITTAGCAWTASGLPEWVAVSGQTSGSGPGAITLVVASNAGPPRSAQIAVAGTPLPLTQASTVLAVNTGGIVNAATGSGPVAPGSIATVLGNFLLETPAAVRAYAIPTTLGGLSLQFGDGTLAPLFYGDAGQVNAQIPWELSGQSETTVSVMLNGRTSASETVSLAAFAPGIFTANGRGTGQGVILDADHRLADTNNPAASGATLRIMCTGLGPVNAQPATGAPASAFSWTANWPQVRIGGVYADVLSSGLVPGSVGLYQVDVRVPAGISSGEAPVVLSIGRVNSNIVTIQLQ